MLRQTISGLVRRRPYYLTKRGKDAMDIPPRNCSNVGTYHAESGRVKMSLLPLSSPFLAFSTSSYSLFSLPAFSCDNIHLFHGTHSTHPRSIRSLSSGNDSGDDIFDFSFHGEVGSQPKELHPKFLNHLRAISARAEILRSALSADDDNHSQGNNYSSSDKDNNDKDVHEDIAVTASTEVGSASDIARELAMLSECEEALAAMTESERNLEGLAGLLADSDPDVRELAEEEWTSAADDVGSCRAACLNALVTATEAGVLENVYNGTSSSKKGGGNSLKSGSSSSSSSPSGPAPNAVLEVRAGTGGHEAGLFAEDLFGMYAALALKFGWRFDVVDETTFEGGGLRQGTAIISGSDVFAHLRWETGVHRVQRVPATEKAGRIHTSTAVVSVLREASETEVVIQKKDLRVDTFRSQGAGGQHVNTTDSAVRLTHLPTNIVVTCQDQRSQHQNRAKAMAVLLSRVAEREREQLERERKEEKAGQTGTGDRSERMRTYNEMQDRVTDHRAGITVGGMQQFLNGEGDALEDMAAARDAQARRAVVEAILNR